MVSINTVELPMRIFHRSDLMIPQEEKWLNIFVQLNRHMSLYCLAAILIKASKHVPTPFSNQCKHIGSNKTFKNIKTNSILYALCSQEYLTSGGSGESPHGHGVFLLQTALSELS